MKDRPGEEQEPAARPTWADWIRQAQSWPSAAEPQRLAGESPSVPDATEPANDPTAEAVRRIHAVLGKLKAESKRGCDSARFHDRNSALIARWARQPESAGRYFGLLVELMKELQSAPLAALYLFRTGYGTEFSRSMDGKSGRTDGLAVYVTTGLNDHPEPAELVGLLIWHRLADAERQVAAAAARSIRTTPQLPPQVGRPRIEVAAAVSPPVQPKPQRPNEVAAPRTIRNDRG